jgi:hypothetical protein
VPKKDKHKKQVLLKVKKNARANNKNKILLDLSGS